MATLTGAMCSTSQCELRSTFPNLRVTNVIHIVTYYTLPRIESPTSSWMTRSQHSRCRDKGLYEYVCNAIRINVKRMHVCTDYETCTKAKDCSEKCVRAYLKRYGRRCTGKWSMTCPEIGRVHIGGPYGCKATWTTEYDQKIRSCCRKAGGC